MKLTAFDAVSFELKLKETFAIANETLDVKINVFMKIVAADKIIERN